MVELERARQALYDSSSPAVVFVNTSDGFGSGIVVSEDGLLLTNAHVVGSFDDVRVIFMDGRTLEGKVVERAKRLDLALVKVEATGLPVLRLSSDPEAVRVGAWAASVGHGRGGIWTFTTGMISNRYSDQGKTVYQTQIPVNPGSSGGPVLDKDGDVIGIVTAGMTNADSINFAIPSFEAVRALEGLGNHCQCLHIVAPETSSVFVDGAMVGTGPELRVPVTPGPHEVFAIVNGKKVDRSAHWPDSPSVRFE